MSDIVDFKKHKELKKAEVIVDELTTAIQTMEVCIKAMSFFMKYIPVMEATSSLMNNKTLLEIHLNKYKRQIEDENKLEKPKE